MLHILYTAAALSAGLVIGLFILKYLLQRQALKKVAELKDCPFKYHLSADPEDDYIIFEFGEDTSLWCDYSFGLRSDGVYGVNKLVIRGINGKRSGQIKLAIGQSVFPLITKMEQFEAWINPKAFNYAWDPELKEVWEEMKKKLDNLRFLETKSIEKENKKKK